MNGVTYEYLKTKYSKSITLEILFPFHSSPPEKLHKHDIVKGIKEKLTNIKSLFIPVASPRHSLNLDFVSFSCTVKEPNF